MKRTQSRAITQGVSVKISGFSGAWRDGGGRGEGGDVTGGGDSGGAGVCDVMRFLR